MSPAQVALIGSSLADIKQLSFNELLDLEIYGGDLSASPIPGFCVLDTRLAWVRDAWEGSLVGRDLGGKQHPEFGGVEIPRSFHTKVAWRF